MVEDFDRRAFMAATSAGFLALLSACGNGGAPPASPSPTPTPTPSPKPVGYGALVSDPAGLFDLPAGFSYRVLSSEGAAMSDGGQVPGSFDGMGCFSLGSGRIALVRNHELSPGAAAGAALTAGYDSTAAGVVLPGGTTTLVLDATNLSVISQFRSLAGTIRNCSGGVTPWGSWLSCEEDTTRAGSGVGRDHGYVFEVPASATAPVNPVPLVAMGRFRHEAAVVDPATGAVFLTEDQDDSLLYRFLPAQRGNLAAGGQLQALALVDGRTDTRNWSSVAVSAGQWAATRWIDLAQPDSPADDLRQRGLALGAARFARGEGIHMGSGELYFVCTSGGAARLGQVFRLDLASGGSRLQLFYESDDAAKFNFGDNITVAPDGQLVICEDQGAAPVTNHLRGITTLGVPYPIARLRTTSELAGACFSPDGKVLFVNIYSPGRTLAITGPWQHLP